jgi:uncharacterized membrane protein
LRVVQADALCDNCYVPLSEDEQRILSEIEQQLYETDPALAREVAETTVYSHAFRNLKWALTGFIIGIVAMIVMLSTAYWLAFGGFLLMLASALWFERNVRMLGRVGLHQMTGGSVREYFGSTSQRMRERFVRDDEET